MYLRLPEHGRPVSVADFSLVKVIGQGSFGKVFMVRPNWSVGDGNGSSPNGTGSSSSSSSSSHGGSSYYGRRSRTGSSSSSRGRGSSSSSGGGGGRVFAMKVVKKSDVKRRNQVSQ